MMEENGERKIKRTWDELLRLSSLPCLTYFTLLTSNKSQLPPGLKPLPRPRPRPRSHLKSRVPTPNSLIRQVKILGSDSHSILTPYSLTHSLTPNFLYSSDN
jgi:hypothetical protein